MYTCHSLSPNGPVVEWVQVLGKSSTSDGHASDDWTVEVVLNSRVPGEVMMYHPCDDLCYESILKEMVQ